MQNIDKLEKVVNEGNYYGAQQMYKSISARFKQFLCVAHYHTFSVMFSSFDLQCEMLF